MTVAELAERIGSGEPDMNLTQGLPIVSPQGKLVGVVTQGDLLRAMRAKDGPGMSVLEAGGSPAIVAFSDERAHDALMRMLEHNIGRLPVVSRDEPARLVGYLNRSSIFGAWSRRIEDEGLRERGWLDGFLRSGRPKPQSGTP
jgi:chloride channel protein, CIC family